MKKILLFLCLGLGAFILSLYLMPPHSGKPHKAVLANFIHHHNPQTLADIAFSIKGRDWHLSEFIAAHNAQLVVINFWATWCAPCRREMPQLDALHAHFAQENVYVLAISLDRGTAAAPVAFLKDLGVRHLISAHDGTFKAGRDVRLQGMPTTLIVNSRRQELGRLAGEADWASREAIALIAQFLGR